MRKQLGLFEYKLNITRALMRLEIAEYFQNPFAAVTDKLPNKNAPSSGGAFRFRFARTQPHYLRGGLRYQALPNGLP